MWGLQIRVESDCRSLEVAEKKICIFAHIRIRAYTKVHHVRAQSCTYSRLLLVVEYDEFCRCVFDVINFRSWTIWRPLDIFVESAPARRTKHLYVRDVTQKKTSRNGEKGGRSPVQRSPKFSRSNNNSQRRNRLFLYLKTSVTRGFQSSDVTAS